MNKLEEEVFKAIDSVPLINTEFGVRDDYEGYAKAVAKLVISKIEAAFDAGELATEWDFDICETKRHYTKENWIREHITGL